MNCKIFNELCKFILLTSKNYNIDSSHDITHSKIQIDDEDRNAISNIINTMSYSKVKVNGFPNLGIYQSAYHIVREADLLSAYDFDRCLIYGLHVRGDDFETTFPRAEELFKSRVFRHAEDNLFTTEYAKTCYPGLHLQAINRISYWKNILHISS